MPPKRQYVGSDNVSCNFYFAEFSMFIEANEMGNVAFIGIIFIYLTYNNNIFNNIAN